MARKIRKTQKKPNYVNLVHKEQAGVAFAFDLVKAPVPQRIYCAEFCDLIKSPNGNFNFLFSDYNSTLEKANHTLTVTFSDIALLSLWHNSDRFVKETLKHLHEIYKLNPEQIQSFMGSEKTQTLMANMVMMARSDGDIEFSFYNLSPRNSKLIAQGQTTSEGWVEGIVEIKTTLKSAFPLLAKIEGLTKEILNDYPELQAKIEEKQKAMEA